MEGRCPEPWGDATSLPGSCPCRCPHADSVRVGGHQAAVRQPWVSADTPLLPLGQLDHVSPVQVQEDKPLAWEAQEGRTGAAIYFNACSIFWWGTKTPMPMG